MISYSNTIGFCYFTVLDIQQHLYPLLRFLVRWLLALASWTSSSSLNVGDPTPSDRGDTMARTVEEKYNQRLIIGITTVLLVLCYIFFFLRILSRRLLQTPLWYDDWYMLFALVIPMAEVNAVSF